jgi:hypothetical protein
MYTITTYSNTYTDPKRRNFDLEVYNFRIEYESITKSKNYAKREKNEHR